jgi:hypothetical protein
VQPSREEVLAREERWGKPAGFAAFLAVVTLLAAGVVGASVHGTDSAEILRSANEHSSSVTLSGALLTIGFLLLAAPIAYLFRAVQARSARVQGMIIGLVLIAPLFLGLSTSISSAARNEAADEFVAGTSVPALAHKEAREECASEGKKKRAACEREKVEEKAAEQAESDASLAGPATGLGIAGGLAMIVALFYTCLWAMRTGLLGRFWASLGMALGITILLGFLPFTLLWFVYLGLLLCGWVPGGRPPAWEAGEAVPWPSPGEKAAAGLEGPRGDEEHLAGPEPEGPDSTPAGDGDVADAQMPTEPRRKRKRRD